MNLHKSVFKKTEGGYANVTPDRLKEGMGEYKNFKAGEPNQVFTKDEKKKLGKTLLGGGVVRKEGL